MIIVLFVALVGNLGYKFRPNKQLTTDFPAHKNVEDSFIVQFSRRLVVCAASLARRRLLCTVPYLHSYPSNHNFGCCNEVTPELNKTSMWENINGYM